jgi:hypothetical protein
MCSFNRDREVNCKSAEVGALSDLGDFFVQTIPMETNFEEKTPKTIDVNSIRMASDLDALKKNDPFMYYSIPAVREKAMRGKAVDLSTVVAASAKNNTVKRRSSISFESIDGGGPSEEEVAKIANDAKMKYGGVNGKDGKVDISQSFLDNLM